MITIKSSMLKCLILIKIKKQIFSWENTDIWDKIANAEVLTFCENKKKKIKGRTTEFLQ